jgi:hypothetical protein
MQSASNPCEAKDKEKREEKEDKEKRKKKEINTASPLSL